MTLGQYLIRLIFYAGVIVAAMIFAQAKWQNRRLLGVWAAVVAMTIVYFLMAARPAGSVSPVMSILVAVTAETVVASIVWARRRSRRMPERLLTWVAATLVFDMWWFSVAYALIAKH